MPSSYDIIHSKKNEIIVCEFNTAELLMEDDVVGTRMPGLGSIKITIYGNEAYGIPHFHILKKTNERVSCICLFEARYFVHGGYKALLNSKQKKQLDKILRLPNKTEPELTNWEYMAKYWISHNDSNNLYNKRKYKQPDYTKLDGFIQE